MPEGIPLSLTLLYPFADRHDVDDHREALQSFFASYEPFELALARLEQWDDGGAVYAAPDPEEPLRGMMRALWRLFPQFPPYGEPGIDPPPHASLTLSGGEDRDATRARVEERLAGVLPARFRITEAALMEETEPDRWRVREKFRLGT